MTDKELHKLGRRDLLQLLVQQGKEAQKVKQQLEQTEEQLHQLEETYERLRKRLDQKDEQIHQLKDELEAERKKREIKFENAGSIAEAALKLNGFLGTAQGVALPDPNNASTQQLGQALAAPPRTAAPREAAETYPRPAAPREMAEAPQRPAAPRKAPETPPGMAVVKTAAPSPGTGRVPQEAETGRAETLLQGTETAQSPAIPRKGTGRSNSAKVVARMARARRAGR